MARLARYLLGATLVIALVFGAASAAFAAPTLTLWATKTTVTYPQATWLKLVSADGSVTVPTAVTIQYRPIGTDTWKKLRSVSASRTAEGTVTVPVPPVMLRAITGFRAVGGGLESEVATVSVKAKLSTAKAPASMRAGRRVRIKGFIWPRHAVGSRAVDVTVWKWEAGAWVLKGTVHPKIVSQTLDGSKWQFTRWVGASRKGKWRLQVSHEDLKHAASTSRYSYIRVR